MWFSQNVYNVFTMCYAYRKWDVSTNEGEVSVDVPSWVS